MRRDFTYIDDVVRGILAAIDNCEGYELINLGNSKPVELEYFISLIEKGLAKKADKNYLPMQQADFKENYADIKKAKEILRWEPNTNIEEGIKKFISWFKDYYHL
jgi:UDP-glucuronate 4-epimerase